MVLRLKFGFVVIVGWWEADILRNLSIDLFGFTYFQMGFIFFWLWVLGGVS